MGYMLKNLCVIRTRLSPGSEKVKGEDESIREYILKSLFWDCNKTYYGVG